MAFKFGLALGILLGITTTLLVIWVILNLSDYDGTDNP